MDPRLRGGAVRFEWHAGLCAPALRLAGKPAAQDKLPFGQAGASGGKRGHYGMRSLPAQGLTNFGTYGLSP
jgi:hypothetical protein